MCGRDVDVEGDRKAGVRERENTTHLFSLLPRHYSHPHPQDIRGNRASLSVISFDPAMMQGMMFG